MQTATVKLKTDKFGNCVILKHVTPAELMFLVADNHVNAGGDPILELKEEFEMEKGEVQERDPEGQPLWLDADKTQKKMVVGWVPTDVKFDDKRTPSQERQRLARKYGGGRIGKFFTGAIPAMPGSFEEARQAGIGNSAPSERLLTVGDIPSERG